MKQAVMEERIFEIYQKFFDPQAEYHKKNPANLVLQNSFTLKRPSIDFKEISLLGFPISLKQNLFFQGSVLQLISEIDRGRFDQDQIKVSKVKVNRC